MISRMMQLLRKRFLVKAGLAWVLFLVACKSRVENVQPLFEILDSKKTGINFTNSLTPTEQFNIFKYLYFYNGGGVATGDFNNDGLLDLFFSANQTGNKLYLNKGGLQFKDVTAQSKIPQDGGWSTGVSVVDINNDGLLDIYVCRVGNHKILQSRNQFLLCQGIDKDGVPYYEDKAKEYGLDFSGFSTQAAFFDYDLDGDLDMYLLNHSTYQNNFFGPRDVKLHSYSPLSGDRLYRNNGKNNFTDVTKESGINSCVIGYGLGLAMADINYDGYPDLYVGNDFNENDYLYINQHDGTFKDELTQRMMHTSQFSMGVDIADINNDGFAEIISADMLPSDPYMLKRSLGEDTYDIFNLKIGYGYNHQYTRNNLQLNRRNGMFSEVGLFTGLYATDWSWSPLWFDFDNDGLKDLIVTNGISKRLNDMDYLNFISSETIQQKLKTESLDQKDMDLSDRFPKIKIPNKFFKNRGDLQFDSLTIQNDRGTYSNGAVYADFDNDGDLDVVVNNIDETALLYKNKSNDSGEKSFVEIKLKGPSQNVNAIGAKILVYADGGLRTYEKYPVRGFLSSMETPIHIGLEKTKVDSAFLIWPDNTYQSVQLQNDNSQLEFIYQNNLPKFDYRGVTHYWEYHSKPMKDITAETNFKYQHEENGFSEFDQQPLMPHTLSAEGPALVVGDINKDGMDDVFLGASRGRKSVVFFQDKYGRFDRTIQPDLESDSIYEDIDACIVDVNNDGNPDLLVASGGDEFYERASYPLPRVYLNDGKGNLIKHLNAFQGFNVNASCIVPYDFNGDGYEDLFIGGRSIPYKYGEIPQSYLLLNDGTGRFTNVTEKYSNELSHIGFVTKAVWFDLNNDKQKDLILSLEWGGIIAFINNKGSFTKKILTDRSGWWNFILPVDLNNDGKIDLIAGNLGLNSRLKASEKEPVKLFYSDFDGDGKNEQVLTYFLEGRELPFANYNELIRQMPGLKKTFLYASDFARASPQDLFSASKLGRSDALVADYFSNAVLMNQGDMNFVINDLPWEAQLSSYRDAVTINANDDDLPDILLMGNYYENNIQMGRYDADFGTLLINQGNGSFLVENINGLQIKGQVRHISKINIGKNEAYILAKNNDRVSIIAFDHYK